MLDFPNSPVPGQQFSTGGVVWTWNGIQWTATGTTIGIADAPNDGQTYGRKSVSGSMSWSVVTTGSGGITDAPADSTMYGRKNGTWAHLAHTDITDWTATLAPYALTTSVPVASIATPIMDGTAAVGVGTTWARADHVHPTDTSRYDVGNSAGYQTAANVTSALAPYALTTSVPVASTSTPLINGTAAVGVGTTWARGDHVHPTDTSRAAASALAGYLPLTGGTLTGALTATQLSSTGNILGGGGVYPNYGANTTAIVTASAGALNMMYNSNNYFSAQTGAAYLVAAGISCSWNGSTFSAANVNCSGAVSAAGISSSGNSSAVNLLASSAVFVRSSSNPILYLQNAAGSVTYGQVYSTGSATTLANISLACSVTLGGNVSLSPSSGNNLLLSPGVGFQTGGGPWNALSDSRIKTVDRDFELGLDEVLKLRPVVYRYKGNDTLTEGEPSMHEWAKDKPFIGFVAQEVEQVFPGMVEKSKGWIDGVEVDDLRTLNTGPLIYALVNAVKQLAARVAELEAAR